MSIPSPAVSRVAPLRALAIGAWTFDQDAGRLSRPASDGALDEVRLAPKTAKVLDELAAVPGQVVTRETLFDRVWPHAAQTPDLLNHAIRELRRALGDDIAAPVYIETIPKVGYRLMVSVTAVGGEVATAPAEADVARDPRDENQAATAARRQRDAPSHEADAARAPTLALAVVAALAALTVAAPLLRRDAAPIDAAGRSRYTLASPRYVTSEPGRENSPRLSPDGSLVVYTAVEPGTRRHRVHLRAVEGTRTLRVSEEQGDGSYDERLPAFSPDGSRLAFARVRDDRDCRVVVTGVLGGVERTVYTCRTTPEGSVIGAYDWSADGGALYVGAQLEADAPTTLALLDIDSGVISALDYAPRASDHDLDPRVSPDGRLLAFRRGAVPYSNLYVMPTAGGHATRVTDDTSLVRGYDWLPDSSGLLVSSDRDARQALYVATLAERRLQPLGEADAYFPDAAAHRDRIVFQRIAYESRLVEYALDGSGGGHDVTLSTAADWAGQFAPKDRRVAFVSTRSGASAVWLREPDNGGVRLLAPAPGGVPEHPRWSSGGTRIAFTARADGEPAVFAAEVATGAVRQLNPRGTAARYASFAEDGAAIYSQRYGEDWYAVRLADAPDAVPVRYDASVGAGDPVESPDGRHLYYTGVSDPALMRLELATGTVTPVTATLHPRTLDAWQVVGDDVYFLASDVQGVVGLYRAPGAGGEAVLVRHFDGPIGEPTISISPERTHVLVTIAGRQDSDVVVAELERH